MGFSSQFEMDKSDVYSWADLFREHINELIKLFHLHAPRNSLPEVFHIHAPWELLPGDLSVLCVLVMDEIV